VVRSRLSCAASILAKSNTRARSSHLEKDKPARGFIIEQDREIAEKSGRAPLAIKSITRAGAKKK
jgi:hypothetical protein